MHTVSISNTKNVFRYPGLFAIYISTFTNSPIPKVVSSARLHSKKLLQVPWVPNNVLKAKSIRKLTRLFIQIPTFLAFPTSIISNSFQKNEWIKNTPFIHKKAEKIEKQYTKKAPIYERLVHSK